ncbi:MAG TPA: hypothetical protein VE131_00795, partial [Terriglobales bacterium]|nr:hypothetical protein [Terriglobales bacterium]
IVLVRPEADGRFRVLLTRRPAGMRFLGGFYVFPGGTVHENDYSSQVLARCRGLSADAARQLLGGKHPADVALGHWVAVLRELFEEVGVLLCVNETGEPIHADDEQARRHLELRRRAVVRRQLEFGALLETENLFCDLARVVYFDHWITPEIYPMRFDTRFYIAALPPYQTPLGRSEEVTHSLWIKAAEALARIDRRDFPILPPTTTILQRLAQLPSWAQLQAEFRLAGAGSP